MNETTVLIKPASSLCNMKCSYCFYEDVSAHRETKSHGIIEETIWKSIVDDFAKSEYQYNRVNFSFQGGEPLVAGIDFYKRFISYAQETIRDCSITYSIQTNGTLLNEEYCMLFKKHNFLVGISIDGFETNHNKHRFLNNLGSFDSVMDGIGLLRKYGIEFNVLTVLTKSLAKKPKELFEFYEKESFKFVQIIACLADYDTDPTEDLFSCTPELFGSFYVDFYRLWLKSLQVGHYISESFIDNVIHALMGGSVSRCGMYGVCQTQCIIESDGSVYPCDFYVLDEFKLGNVKENNIKTILTNPLVNEFQSHGNDIPSLCHSCYYKNICNGNCKRIRDTLVNDNTCGYQKLLKEIHSTLPQVQKAIAKINYTN